MLKLNPATQSRHEKLAQKFIEQNRWGELNQLMNEHNRLIAIKEEIPCSQITSQMNEADHEESNRLLRKVCILSDIVESAATDLQALLRRYDAYVTLPLVVQTQALKMLAGNIRGIVDAVGNSEYSESFGELCDEIDELVTEAFEKEKKQYQKNNLSEEERWERMIEEVRRINGCYEPDEPEDNRTEIEKYMREISEMLNKLEILINNP